MATKAKVIRNFFKKFFNVDAEGMSEVAVLRDVFKKKYNVDANGGSVVGVLQDVIEHNESIDDGGGVELRTYYMSFVNQTGTPLTRDFRVMGTIDAPDSLRYKAKSLVADGEEVPIYMLKDGTATIPYYIQGNDIDLENNEIIMQRRDESNAWVDQSTSRFFFTTYKVNNAYYFITPTATGTTTWCKDGTHFRFVYRPKA